MYPVNQNKVGEREIYWDGVWRFSLRFEFLTHKRETLM